MCGSADVKRVKCGCGCGGTSVFYPSYAATPMDQFTVDQACRLPLPLRCYALVYWIEELHCNDCITSSFITTGKGKLNLPFFNSNFDCLNWNQIRTSAFYPWSFWTRVSLELSAIIFSTGQGNHNNWNNKHFPGRESCALTVLTDPRFPFEIILSIVPPT